MRYLDTTPAPTAYPAVRSFMKTSHRVGLTDREVEDLLAQLFPAALAEDVEDLAHSLRSFGGTAARRALPGALQGAAVGAAGGPGGVIGGALIGGAGALASGPRKPDQPSATATRKDRPASTAACGPAVARLVAFLASPQSTAALGALLLCGAGQAEIRVGPATVRPQAFITVLAKIAAEADAELRGAKSTTPT